MAKADLNPAIGAVRGRLGNYVFRQQRNQTVISTVGFADERAAPSKKQLEGQSRFRQASAYAAGVLADPLQKQGYRALAEARNQTLQSLLIHDYYTSPTVSLIDLSEFCGQAGDRVRIVAWDDLEVVSVAVVIRDAAGTTLEEGMATKCHEIWHYAITRQLPPDTRVTIAAIAKDRPGNTGAAERNFPS